VKYTVIVKPRAEKELVNLTGQDYKRITLRIRELEKNPRPNGVVKLKTKNNWRIRVGKFRVIYEVNDAVKLVEVVDVLRRNEGTYKGLEKLLGAGGLKPPLLNLGVNHQPVPVEPVNQAYYNQQKTDNTESPLI
jgi:mRNA interferase RelE/StbE